MSEQAIKDRVKTVPFWWHSIDVGAGVVTPGFKTPASLKRELGNMRLPDLKGKTVLDINAWDGFYSFEAERRGAASVTALDYFVWSMDLKEHIRWWEECRAKGISPGPYEKMPYYRPQELPGKIGFDTAKDLKGSRVQQVVGNFMEMDIESLGQFDVTFFLGSLYHMQNPFESLKRLSRVTKEVAVIETEASEFPGFHSTALCEFFESNELNGDTSNWWAPNEKALSGMCRAAGFRRVETVKGPGVWSRFILFCVAKNLVLYKKISPIWRYRAVVHAWK